jgi:imidazolonepropionase-like amidohydrolase
MSEGRRTLIVLLSGAVLSAIIEVSAFNQVPTARGGQLALVGGTIYVSPTEEPIRDGVVLIENTKIAMAGRRASVRVPAGTQTIDCAGLTVMAGFWNSHVHFLQRKWNEAATLPAGELDRQLQAMLTQYGFTSVFDTWSVWQNTRRLRDRIEAGDLPGPRIRSTGEAMFPKGITTTPASWAPLGFMPLEGSQVAQVAEAADVLAASTKLLDAGTDGLKFYAATPGRNSVLLSESAMRAGVEEAHRRGKLVFAHPSSGAGLLAAVRAGVDVLTHTTPQSGAWDQSVLTEMTKARITLIPTLKLWRYEFRHERSSLADGFVDTAIGQLKAWSSAGGTVLFGTDVGYVSEYDPSEEYELMARAGMDFRQILASLTTTPATRFGASKELGRIAPGFLADLTVLRGDVSKDVRTFAAVQYALRDGKIIYRSPH